MDTNTNTSGSGWTTQTNKRNLSSSSNATSNPSSPTPTNQKKKNKKIFATPNRFQSLSQDEPSQKLPNEVNPLDCAETDEVDEVFKPPPPIFIKNVIDFPGLCSALIEEIGVDNFICKSSNDSLKIQTSTPAAYRALVRYLKAEEAEFHTYQLKEDKPLRVVIRNLHPSTPLDLIKDELKIRLFEVRQVTNVLHRVNKNRLPLFFVDLEPTHRSKEIFQLTSFLHTKIKIEEPYKPKIISQCYNCQQYGHTKAYCGYQPRCVRCGADHLSPDCPNSSDVPPKCALCSGNHPANYRGCTIHKDLQRKKRLNSTSNFLHVNTFPKPINVQGSHPSKNNSDKQQPTQTQTYAQATSNTPFDHTLPPAGSEHVPDINKMLTGFLADFKTIINPLMETLVKVISSLSNLLNN
ncbi:unnamed protein product [Macrosiphum euphorbiae]|uniref:Pre-C2HC domain-containing protein n=1 Tax=Macrosiphum euphorbiae TaxID=13131 RepID=A0AAV0VT22_9HEMI|nr:unnamed protein product [Macrosiphum euphorbiae]CAI6348406.1 unnamed protein product [Macrosiphum euphorbiae]